MGGATYVNERVIGTQYTAWHFVATIRGALVPSAVAARPQGLCPVRLDSCGLMGRPSDCRRGGAAARAGTTVVGERRSRVGAQGALIWRRDSSAPRVRRRQLLCAARLPRRARPSRLGAHVLMGLGLLGQLCRRAARLSSAEGLSGPGTVMLLTRSSPSSQDYERASAVVECAREAFESWAAPKVESADKKARRQWAAGDPSAVRRDSAEVRLPCRRLSVAVTRSAGERDSDGAGAGSRCRGDVKVGEAVDGLVGHLPRRQHGLGRCA